MKAQENPPPERSDDWLDGYEAAVRDAVAMVDGLSAPGTGSLSSPVFLRLRSRLVQMAGEAVRRVA
mgnify:FL=1